MQIIGRLGNPPRRKAEIPAGRATRLKIMDYILTVGLEIHAELKTRTKMFCDSKNDPDEVRPNVNICSICMGHPGTLPVINKEAVKHILKVGLALGGQLAGFTEFDRKNYFYPDIPKGYQLSQYEFPLVSGGALNGVSITRVHLEEDTATSIHRDASPSPFHKRSGGLTSRGIFKSSVLAYSDTSFEKGGTKIEDEGGFSLVDFNRAGVPLMELVTEPVISSAREAADFARELQLLLRYLGASGANMEKGEMRVEANISVSKEREKLGTKVEVKNLNSFRAVERAITYEMNRHIECIESGQRVLQETRGWNEDTGKTFSQRRKEESHDYRYFPDPDLSKLAIADIPEFAVSRLKNEMPTLPWEKRQRYALLGIKADDAEILLANRSIAALLEAVEGELKDKSRLLLAANYSTSDLLGLIKKAGLDGNGAALPFSFSAFAKLIGMVADKKLSSRGAKDILRELFEKGGEPEELAAHLGLLQQSDEKDLQVVAEDVVAAHRKVAEDYKSGKTAALQFLVGQGMKATRGSANPEVLREMFISLLK